MYSQCSAQSLTHSGHLSSGGYFILHYFLMMLIKLIMMMTDEFAVQTLCLLYLLLDSSTIFTLNHHLFMRFVENTHTHTHKCIHMCASGKVENIWSWPCNQEKNTECISESNFKNTHNRLFQEIHNVYYYHVKVSEKICI